MRKLVHPSGDSSLASEQADDREQVCQADLSDTSEVRAYPPLPDDVPLAAILAVVTDAVIAADADQRIVLFNTGAAQIFGYQSDEALGQPLDLLLPARYVATHRQHIRDFAAAVEPARPHPMDLQREVIGRRKDGTEFPAEASIAKLTHEGRTIFVVILRDISERKRVEQELHQVEARYRLLVESVQDYAIFMLDPEGCVISWNTGAERVKGYRVDEIVGHHFACFFLDDDVQRGEPSRELREAVADGHCITEGWRVRKDGSRFWASIVVTALRDENGQLRGFAKVTRDITERKRAEEEIRSGRERLQALSHRLIDVQESERRAIAGELHDEIGQALTVVKVNLQALQRLPGAAAIGPHLDESIGTVEHALQQVRNLSLDLRPSLLDDLGLVAALRWYAARQARVARFTLQLVVDPFATRLPAALETTCFRVAQEALTNVVRHAQAQQVTVELRQHDAELHLLIRDDGVGFDVAAAQARAIRGASLGLLGIQERVTIAGGRIQIESIRSQGTTIHACFPLDGLPVRADDDERSDRS